MKYQLNFILNGQKQFVSVPYDWRLIDILRNHFNLTGTREGCGIGECGACTVLMNNKAVCSCMLLAGQVEGSSIETIEFAGEDRILQTIQEAFLESGAVQCGFCTPGMIMSTKALLLTNPLPTVPEIKTALEGNLCRCTGYAQIIEAVQLAAKNLAE